MLTAMLTLTSRHPWVPPPPDPRAQSMSTRNVCTYAQAKRALKLCDGDEKKAEGLAHCATMVGASLGDMVSAFEHMKDVKSQRLATFPREFSCEVAK